MLWSSFANWRIFAALAVLPLISSCALLGQSIPSTPHEVRESVHVTEAELMGVWQDSRGGELRIRENGRFSAKRLLMVGGRDDVEGAPEWAGREGSWVFYEDSEGSGVQLILNSVNTAVFETVRKDGEVLLSAWVDEGEYYEFTRDFFQVPHKEKASANPMGQ